MTALTGANAVGASASGSHSPDERREPPVPQARGELGEPYAVGFDDTGKSTVSIVTDRPIAPGTAG
ncbi:hypothetical protein ACFW2I_14905 [Streptomyces nigra]|uniref:hypothetical protein n=1 Tax=Streptomyces nigra TaxID=1827580 RepID=UPI0036B64F38